MDRADAGAGQHGIGGLGDHREVDDHAVAFANAQRFQHVGHAADAAVQVVVGDRLRLFVGVVGFEYDGGLVAARFQMAVDAVGGDVQGAVAEPLDADLPKGEIDVLDLGRGLHPIQPLRLLGPEPLRVADRGRIHRVIARRVDVGGFDLFVGWGVGLAHRALLQKVIGGRENLPAPEIKWFLSRVGGSDGQIFSAQRLVLKHFGGGAVKDDGTCVQNYRTVGQL